MALDAIRAESASEHPSPAPAPDAPVGDRIDRLSMDIQGVLYKMQALGHGISDAIDAVSDGGERGKVGWGMVNSFADLIVDQSKLGLAMAEAIECIGLTVRQRGQ